MKFELVAVAGIKLGPTFGVPAQSYHYRALLQSLAREAGWPITSANFRVFLEPYAVLLAQTANHPASGTYLIIDVGGGTTDWALVTVKPGAEGPQFDLLDTLVQHAAGSDVDRELAKELLGAENLEPIGSGDVYRLEEEKIRLSREGPLHDTEFILMDKRRRLTWKHLEDATRQVFTEALDDAYQHFSQYQLNHVLLVGGGSQSPGLRELVIKRFGESFVRDRPEESFLTTACSLGLTHANSNQVLSGLETEISFMEYPTQKRTTWIQAFDTLPPDAPVHDKRFVFSSADPANRHIPLFVQVENAWQPAGYLTPIEDDVVIRPVWTDYGLVFFDAQHREIPWTHQSFPYLIKGLAVRYEHNTVANQSTSGVGVIDGFTGQYRALESWTGNTDKVVAIVKADAHSQTNVRSNAGGWQILNVPKTLGLLSLQDFNRYDAIPMPSLALSSYQAIPIEELSEAPFPGYKIGGRVTLRTTRILRALEERMEHLENTVGMG